jgi:hypothetical protein
VERQRGPARHGDRQERRPPLDPPRPVGRRERRLDHHVVGEQARQRVDLVGQEAGAHPLEYLARTHGSSLRLR